ncbi:MAG: major capsid protein [Candidatus Hydrogenedentes bacterium]|nr:major capsid protein [Candidatus Hydrogenedentota bacterium]
MPYAPVDIPELRLEVLTKFITKFTAPPELMITPMFGSSSAESDTITWESVRGSRGLAPFIAPGSASPTTAPAGIAAHSAKAAFLSEKIGFTEEWLNNMRKAGTLEQYATAQEHLAREYANLVNRNRRRKEWMLVKMLCDGSFSYEEEGGTRISVDYDIPADQQVTLTSTARWGQSAADILGNVMDAKSTVKQANNGTIDAMLMNTTALKLMAADTNISGLLRKDAFGDGSLRNGNLNNLVAVNPNVLAGLLDIPQIIIYDEAYEVRSLIVGAVTGSSTTAIPVADTVDFEVGGTLRFYDVSAGTYEDETIASIQTEAGTVTVSSAPTASFKAGEDYVMMTKMFVPDNKVIFFTKAVEGEAVAEWKNAPFGIPRGYDLTPKSWLDTDPDMAWVRVQNKGLPVLYHRDAIYQLTVT